MTFVHLHNHTHYSILTGLAKPKDYVKKAKSFGMPAAAITDTGNIHGLYEFYNACISEGINPILGCEILVSSEDNKNNSKDKIEHELVLLAKNFNGYKNIIKIVTEANLDTLNMKSVVDINLIKKYSSDLICLSGPISGEIPFLILAGKKDEEILEKINYYKNIFGEDNYYVELLYHDDIPKQRFVTDKLIELYQKYDIPVVAANNSHYIEKSDKETQDVIMCLNSGHEVDNPDRPTLINGDYSFLSPDEMEALFGHIPIALKNTIKIADSIDIKIPDRGILIPKYELPETDQIVYNEAKNLEKNNSDLMKLSSDEWYLRYLCFEGLNWRFDFGIDKNTIFEFVKKIQGPNLGKKLQESSPEELKTLSQKYYTEAKKKILSSLTEEKIIIIERLEYELTVVHEMGFDAYFLIVADYIAWAREKSIPVGPGRGSAAGALLAYLSGITDIDPLKYNLLFERFLNPARVSMPDIDIDFSDDARDLVIDYCRRKYGNDHVAQICTFGTFAARAAVKDVGRVMGIPFSEMNELVKLIPEKPGTKLKNALEESIEFKEAYNTKPIYKNIIDRALKIEGNVRQLGVHACAVIIAPEKITNFTALQHPPKDDDVIITQYSAGPLEDLGLLKMDFLGLRNLTIIKRAIKIIQRTKNVTIDISTIDLDDPKVFNIFATGDTTGVFQFESSGMRKYLKGLKPNTFEDIIAMVSLYRPGPLQYIPTYIDRKHGIEKVEYAHSSLEKILKPTHGIAVYQEQIMQMVQTFAGFSLGQADILRRAIGKKKIDVLLDQKQKFTKAAGVQGHSEKLALHIFEDVIEPFAGYGFNKSHAACYSLIAYQTAYLKAYFPTEFLTAIMTSDEENTERVVLEVSEAKSKGIKILPPSISESLKHFTYIDDNTIRFGLKAIKGLGDSPIDKIILERKEEKYGNLEDFIKKVGGDAINKKSLEALILSGSMDEFGDRATLFINISEMIRFSKLNQKKQESSQIGLFDMGGDFVDTLDLKKTEPYNLEQKLIGEKTVVGFNLSGHPLDGLKTYVDRRNSNTEILKKSFEEIAEDKLKNPKKNSKSDKKNNTIAQAIGVITEIRDIVTKTGKKMLIISCESFGFNFETVIFSKDYEKYAKQVEENKIVIVNGFIIINEEYNRKTIQMRDLKILTLTQVRSQAKDLDLLDSSIFSLSLFPDLEEAKTGCSIPIESVKNNKTEKSTKKINKYIVKIPQTANKNNLLDLKKLLSTEKPGNIKVFIEIKGKEVYTKFDILNLSNLNNWEDLNFS